MRWWLIVVASGCGRIAFEPSSRNDGGGADACTFGPWGTPVAQPAVNTPNNEVSPFLTNDGLTLIFESNRGGTIGQYDLYSATRATRADAFGNVTNFIEVNSTADDTNPSLTADELTLYLSSTRGGAPRLHRATRTSTAAKFDPPQLVPELANEAMFAPEISADGLELFYTTSATNGGLMRAVRNEGGPFVVTGPVTELDALGVINYPSQSADGKTLYFAYDPTPSNQRLHTAQRTGRGAPFTNLRRLVEVDTASAQGDPSISIDDQLLVFTSIGTTADIYIASRSCL